MCSIMQQNLCWRQELGLIMACRDVWNTWHEGPRSPQTPTAKQEGFVATGGTRAMYLTHHGKLWLKHIIVRPLGKYGTKL